MFSTRTGLPTSTSGESMTVSITTTRFWNLQQAVNGHGKHFDPSRKCIRKTPPSDGFRKCRNRQGSRKIGVFLSVCGCAGRLCDRPAEEPLELVLDFFRKRGLVRKRQESAAALGNSGTDPVGD